VRWRTADARALASMPRDGLKMRPTRLALIFVVFAMIPGAWVAPGFAAPGPSCHETPKDRRVHFRQWRAARTAHFRARKIARVQRFEADQLERRTNFTAMLEREKLAFSEAEHTPAERAQSRESLQQQRQAFRLSQSTLLKEFRADQLARRRAFEAWIRKHRALWLANRCGAAASMSAPEAEPDF
jgi:hypothetical protein